MNTATELRIDMLTRNMRMTRDEAIDHLRSRQFIRDERLVNHSIESFRAVGMRDGKKRTVFVTAKDAEQVRFMVAAYFDADHRITVTQMPNKPLTAEELQASIDAKPLGDWPTTRRHPRTADEAFPRTAEYAAAVTVRPTFLQRITAYFK